VFDYLVGASGRSSTAHTRARALALHHMNSTHLTLAIVFGLRPVAAIAGVLAVRLTPFETDLCIRIHEQHDGDKHIEKRK
jgi:hypothetical protein